MGSSNVHSWQPLPADLVPSVSKLLWCTPCRIIARAMKLECCHRSGQVAPHLSTYFRSKPQYKAVRVFALRRHIRAQGDAKSTVCFRFGANFASPADRAKKARATWYRRRSGTGAQYASEDQGPPTIHDPAFLCTRDWFRTLYGTPIRSKEPELPFDIDCAGEGHNQMKHEQFDSGMVHLDRGEQVCVGKNPQA